MQMLSLYELPASYQLYAYQEGPQPPNSSLWKRVRLCIFSVYYVLGKITLAQAISPSSS